MSHIHQYKAKAEDFVKEYGDCSKESSDMQIFWTKFFEIFSINVRGDGKSFEHSIKDKKGNSKSIDYFWKGNLIIEHKSEGKITSKAYKQILNYYNLVSDDEKPKHLILSDFKEIILLNIKTETIKKVNFENIDLSFDKKKILLKDLPDHIKDFEFIYTFNKNFYGKEKDLNFKASELMAEIYDSLKKTGHNEHELEILLVRILFCLYAEDTGIFNDHQFENYIRGTLSQPVMKEDVGRKLLDLFETLDTPIEDRDKNLPNELKEFDYADGGLFEERLSSTFFEEETYDKLKEACKFNWYSIDSAIFGSIFQYAMDIEKRHNLGVHYTSKSNILKVINPLFMDNLWEEYESILKSRRAKYIKADELINLQNKMGKMRFLDPACGCGNFLVVAFEELRKLELRIIDKIDEFKGDVPYDDNSKQISLDIEGRCKVKIDHFYGIEAEEFPTHIAEVSMLFTQYKLNEKYQARWDKHATILPITSKVNVYNKNALRTNWDDEVLKSSDDVYIFGNPPFVSKDNRSNEQNEDMKKIFKGFKNVGSLDYCSAWYKKALDYIKDTKIQVAFISTNSIIQGRQVPILWNKLHEKYVDDGHDFYFNFAYQSFEWTNESKNKAGVYVVIIGFSFEKRDKLYLYSNDDNDSPIKKEVQQINNYLYDDIEVSVDSSSSPLFNQLPCRQGIKLLDGGFLTINYETKKNEGENTELINAIKPLISAGDFLNNKQRWCYWLLNSDLPNTNKIVRERVYNVEEFRRHDSKEGAKFVDSPESFRYAENFVSDFSSNVNKIIIPRLFSKNYRYVVAKFQKRNSSEKEKSSEVREVIDSSCNYIFDGDLYHFAMIISKMHIIWLNFVGGKFKSDPRHSIGPVYNTFPFPEDLSDDQKDEIEKRAINVLKCRKKYEDQSLHDLYCENMPIELQNAHNKLDEAIDSTYREKKFVDEYERFRFLYGLYREKIDNSEK